MELWTPEHIQTILPALAIMIVVGIILRLTIGKKDLKIRMIPFQILAVAIVILEIGKQIVSYQKGYDLYHIPLHFCSLFIFALPVMAFYRGKHRERVFEVVSVLCMSMTLFMLIYPNIIYSAGNIENYFETYLDFHTVTFHNIVMFAMVLIFALDLNATQNKPAVKELTVVMLIFCAISAGTAQIMEVNYAQFYRSNVDAVNGIRDALEGALGYGLMQVIYVLIMAALNLGFVLLSCAVYRLVKKLLTPKTPATV